MADVYRLVDAEGRPLDDDREDYETPAEWLKRWQTVEGFPDARLQRSVMAWEDVSDA